MKLFIAEFSQYNADNTVLIDSHKRKVWAKSEAKAETEAKSIANAEGWQFDWVNEF